MVWKVSDKCYVKVRVSIKVVVGRAMAMVRVRFEQ